MLALPLTLSALALSATPGIAQGPCANPNIGATVQSPPAPQAGLTEVWVDPINGNDGTGAVNDGTLPFATIAQALLSLQAALTASGGASAANRGLIHLNAGIYSATTNGESFPLLMSDWIDVQGVGAKQTVLRGTGATSVSTFLPLDDNCECGVRSNNVVLVDFSNATDGQYDEMIDGVTFQGGDIQVYAEADLLPLHGRVSNSIFDLLHNPGEGYTGPQFGILMVHNYQGDGGEPNEPGGGGEPGEPGDPGDYNDVRLNIFNNTFVQSWDASGAPDPVTPMVSALDESVAICDVNDPGCFTSNIDPNRSLRGVGNPNIQSNLIRAFDTTPPTALLGIDNGDVTCAVGTRLGATNAFDPASVGGQGAAPVTPGFFYCSNIVGTLPVPAQDAGGNDLNPNGALAGGQDPAFVGEALSVSVFGLVPMSHARDFRILQDSPYVDQGTQPAANGVLAAANGTVHTDLSCSPQSSFDFDGEYWGNPRVGSDPLAAVANPAVIDIGYDEASILIDAAVANDSIVHAPTVVGAYGPATGLGYRTLIYPDSAGPSVDFHTVWAINTPLAAFTAGFTAYSHFPGSLTSPVPFPGTTFTAPFNTQWLDPTAGLGLFNYIGLEPLAPIPYTSPFDGSSRSYNLATATSAMALTGAPAYFAEQAIYLPAGGPNAGALFLGNLQGLHD